MRFTFCKKMARPIQILSVTILLGSLVLFGTVARAEETNESIVDRSYWAIERIESSHKTLREILRTNPRPKDFDKQLEDCRKTSREARTQIDELIARIKNGEAIFSYPGLIKLGRIRYVGSADGAKDLRGTYYLEFLIGFSDTDSGGSEPRYYEVHFDNKGIILDHQIRPRMTE